MAHDIFISYTTSDKQIADAVCHAVENEGIRCWLAPRDIRPGENFPSEIMNGIEACKIFILVASKNIKKSKHVLNEVNAAVDKNKIIIPFKIDDDRLNDDYHYYIGKTHWIEAFPDPQVSFGKLIKTLAIFLEKEVSKSIMEQDFDQEQIAQSNKKVLINKTYEERFSFGLSIANEKDQEVIDNIHFYEYVKRIDVISVTEQKYSSYRWLTLVNKSDTPSTYIIHKECGENKIRFESMNIRACIENYQGEKLLVENLTKNQPNFEQIFKIHFNKALMPDEQIKIYYRIDWPSEPASYSDEKVSNSISFTRYKRGCGRLFFANLESTEISGVEIHGITKTFEEESLNLPFRAYKLEEDNDLKPLYGKGYLGFCFEEKDPEYIAYRFFYKIFKDDVNNENFF